MLWGFGSLLGGTDRANTLAKAVVVQEVEKGFMVTAAR
jgi:hypothetical protein